MKQARGSILEPASQLKYMEAKIKKVKDRIDYWIKNGAQLSHGYLRITKQAPQKPPRKPKKSQVEGAPKEIKEEKIEEKVEEVKEEEKTEEAPVETNEHPTTDQEKK